MSRYDKTRPGVAAPGRAEDTRAEFDKATLSDTQFTTAAPGGQRSIAERLSGVPICSDTLNGFYMPSNDEEKARCIRSLRRRGIEILRVAEAMNRIPGDGQMELDYNE